MAKFAVVTFPGSNCVADCVRALKNVMHQDVVNVWHTETHLAECDAVVLPGGFSYGDYLRAGAIARFSPIMGAVRNFAERGGLVLGICNGFQILVEAGLLPGALLRNASLKFVCRPTWLTCERRDTAFTSNCAPDVQIPIAHGQGRYHASPDVLARIEANGQVLFRYTRDPQDSRVPENPNGSLNRIAGIINERGNVLGMMPHPERACEMYVGGGEHGRGVFASMIRTLRPSETFPQKSDDLSW